MKKQKDIVATHESFVLILLLVSFHLLSLILIQLGNKNLNISPNNTYFLLSDLSLKKKVAVAQYVPRLVTIQFFQQLHTLADCE